MRQKEEKVLRLALILLAASLSVQLVGIPAGMGNPPAKGAVLVADGPMPRPPIRLLSPSTS